MRVCGLFFSLYLWTFSFDSLRASNLVWVAIAVVYAQISNYQVVGPLRDSPRSQDYWNLATKANSFQVCLPSN